MVGMIEKENEIQNFTEFQEKFSEALVFYKVWELSALDWWILILTTTAYSLFEALGI